MNIPYSSSFGLPAPVIDIELSSSGTSLSAGPYSALVDTGADVTMLPQSVLLSLGAPSVYEKRLRSVWGEPRDVLIYLVDIIIGAERFPGIEVAGDEQEEEYILGRDLLNRLPLFLDGPQQTVQLLTGQALQRARAARPSE